MIVTMHKLTELLCRLRSLWPWSLTGHAVSSVSTLLIAALLVTGAGTANVYGSGQGGMHHGVELPGQLRAGDWVLGLNGAGKRTKLAIKLYVAGLYLNRKSDSGAAIVAADAPMAVRLVITSSLVSPKRMDKALRSGFSRSTPSPDAGLAQQIDGFVSVVANGILEGDIYDLIWKPGAAVDVVKNDEVIHTVAGLKFKKALFGILLGANPVQKSLKAGLLGN